VIGSFQSSWVLIDFYWNRDDYTQRYCQFLDQGITQCRASCYLENQLETQQQDHSDAKIVSSQKVNVVELSSSEEYEFEDILKIEIQLKGYLSCQNHFDFHLFIFHPPKA
jgi:peptide methionine sulfoxide reductase MsrA